MERRKKEKRNRTAAIARKKMFIEVNCMEFSNKQENSLVTMFMCYGIVHYMLYDSVPAAGELKTIECDS